MKYIKLFENFEKFDPYDLMIISPQKKAQMIIDEIRSGDVNNVLIDTLITMGADINWQDDDGWTALNYAISFNKLDICKMLIDAGIDPNTRDINGATPVHYASKGYGQNDSIRIKILQLLINAGGNVNLKDEAWTWTPLMYTIHSNNIDALKILLEVGANPNIQSDNGNTSLHWAILFHLISSEIIKDLLEFGANPKIENEDGKTSFDLAKDLNKPDILKLLEENFK